MRQYFTYVEFFDGKNFIPIAPHLKTQFGNLAFTFESCFFSGDPSVDNRKIGYIDADDDNRGTGQQKIDAILRTLNNYEKETPNQVKTIIEKWTGRDDITISNGIVDVPDII